ncbi:MAG: glutathione S-transferase family protein [Phenylobacterium sp.]|uniref:glutathione S-transferase family protein n=1 Tax=Phenylobacterium sp. TaxID=1871053 RepID=UPI0012019816|nr:glutathione S-transferase family protein [Phenylobacterium sp.]TAJ71865.1 MAG: glutathione S-transferase family protein [Phenylobacterium sp.]
MHLYDSPMPAPNPRRVRTYLAEKGLSLPTTIIDLAKGEHRTAEYRAINPLGRSPALRLDDGRVVVESVAICRYIEHFHPDPPMFGVDPFNTAEIEALIRRIELRLQRAITMVWLHTHEWNAPHVKPQFKAFGESQKGEALIVMREFDELLAGREWLDGQRYTMADVVLLSYIDWAAFVGVAYPADFRNLRAWHARASARPSAAA